MNNEDLPAHLDPFAIMREHGFRAYVDEARAVLPDDWETKYRHAPRTLAYGLTYYVAYTEFTQVKIASRYGVPDISVRKPYATLKDDLGNPTTRDR